MDDEEGCFHHASHSKGCHLRLKSGEVVESSLVYMKCIRIRTRVSGSDGLKSYLFLNLRLHLILPPLLQLVLKKNYQTLPLLCHKNFFPPHFGCLPGSDPNCPTCNHHHRDFASATPSSIVGHMIYSLFSPWF